MGQLAQEHLEGVASLTSDRKTLPVHTTTWQGADDEADWGEIVFQHNGDFSGDVAIRVESPRAKLDGSYVDPFFLLLPCVALLSLVAEYLR